MFDSYAKAYRFRMRQFCPADWRVVRVPDSAFYVVLHKSDRLEDYI